MTCTNVSLVSRTPSGTVIRASRKYQWIALHELLGCLSDPFHFSNYQEKVEPFRTFASITTTRLDDRRRMRPEDNPTFKVAY